MRLIGMLDSPYVRRVAISLELLGVEFTHEAVSVFRDFEKFKSINSVVKAPSLVCDDGTVLMDSSLILQFIETVSSNTSLWSSDAKTLPHEIRAVGLAMVGCEKSAQLLYEKNMRPAEFQYEPWLDRVAGQIRAAFSALEDEVKTHVSIFRNERSHASIMSAIAWQFVHSMLASIIPADAHPHLVELSMRMEKLPVFLKYTPSGPGIPVAGK